MKPRNVVTAARQFLSWCMQAPLAIAAAAAQAAIRDAEARKTMSKEELRAAREKAQIAYGIEFRMRNLYGRNWDRRGAIERKPHQGAQEIARRLRQRQRGLIEVAA
jgi:hypothetical protein